MEFLLTVFIVLFLIGFIIRLLSPFLLKLLVKRMSKRFEQQGYNAYNRHAQSQRPEGEVTIEQNKLHEKMIDKNFGEYVDFEEQNKG